MPMNIAIDGPVGAGKSWVADEVAARLGILHLDTGAMYRTLGLYALRSGINMDAVALMGRTIKDLAAASFISADHLTRLFKKKFGETPLKYKKKVSINRHLQE